MNDHSHPTYNVLIEALAAIAYDAEIGNRDAIKAIVALDEAGFWIGKKPRARSAARDQ